MANYAIMIIIIRISKRRTPMAEMIENNCEIFLHEYCFCLFILWEEYLTEG